MEQVSDRINQILRDRNVNKTRLAEIAGVSNQAVTFWIKRNQISIEAAKKLCAALDLSIDWLLTGKIDSNNKSNATLSGKIDEWDNNTPLDDDEILVPFYKDIRLSAGNGFSNDIEDYNGYKLRLSKSTMRRYGIDKACVVCVTVNGNSMEPVFKDGSTVGIDKADTKIKDGKIYAFNHDGLLRIKMLEQLPGNQVKIKSYNSDYEDETIPQDAISILGRVWWSSSIFE